MDQAWRFLKFTFLATSTLLPGTSKVPGLELRRKNPSSSSTSGPGISMKPAKLGSPAHPTSLKVGTTDVGSLVGCAHPTVWKFLDALRQEQALSDIKITSHLTRKPFEPRSQKWIKHDQRLNIVTESYGTYDDV